MTAIKGFESAFLADRVEVPENGPVKVATTALDSLQNAVQLGKIQAIFQELQAMSSGDVERVLTKLKETYPEQSKKIDEVTTLWQLRQALLHSSVVEVLKIAALLPYSVTKEVIQQLQPQNSSSVNQKLTDVTNYLDKATKIEKLLAERNFGAAFRLIKCTNGVDALVIKLLINFIGLRQQDLSFKERAINATFSSIINRLLDEFNSEGVRQVDSKMRFLKSLSFSASIIDFIENNNEHNFINSIISQPLLSMDHAECFTIVKQEVEKMADSQMQKELNAKLLAAEQLTQVTSELVAALKGTKIPLFLNQIRQLTNEKKQILYSCIEKNH